MSTPPGRPTAYQVRLMRHACGMDSRDPYYQDYFAAEPGFEDDEHWGDLVRKGLADVRREPCDYSPYRIYGVTPAGKELIGHHNQEECFK